MKKTILLCFFVSGLMLSSCKKAYTCDCTLTETDSNSSGGSASFTGKNTSTAYSQKMSKKTAQSACDHEATAVRSNAENVVTAFNGSPDPTVKYTATCTLK